MILSALKEGWTLTYELLVVLVGTFVAYYAIMLYQSIERET